MDTGYIYILINPSLEKDLLKIGKTTKSPEERASEISSSTGVATPYYVAYELKTNNCHLAEAILHKELAEYRYKSNREFFKIPLREAIKLVETILNENIKSKEESITDEQELDDNHKMAESINDLGFIEHKAGNYPKAIDLYKKALNFKPDFWECYSNLGATYYMLGHNEEAENSIKKALEINPKSAIALNILGAIYHDSNLYDKAINVLEESLNIDPNQAPTYNNVAAIYFKRKLYEKAIFYLKHSIKLDPGDPQTHYNLGVCYCEMPNPNRHAAEKHYEVLLNLDKRMAYRLGKIISPFGGVNVSINTYD